MEKDVGDNREPRLGAALARTRGLDLLWQGERFLAIGPLSLAIATRYQLSLGQAFC